MDCSCNIKTVKLPNVEPYVKEYVKVLLTRLICKVKQNWPWYKKPGSCLIWVVNQIYYLDIAQLLQSFCVQIQKIV